MSPLSRESAPESDDGMNFAPQFPVSQSATSESMEDDEQGAPSTAQGSFRDPASGRIDSAAPSTVHQRGWDRLLGRIDSVDEDGLRSPSDDDLLALPSSAQGHSCDLASGSRTEQPGKSLGKIDTSSFVCFECHYPVCAMPECGTRATAVPIGNNLVSKTTFAELVATSTIDVEALYGSASERWFCMDCRYPACHKQTSPDCVRVRSAKPQHRFQRWTCDACAAKQLCPTCRRDCLQDSTNQQEPWATQLAALEQAVRALKRLPTRYDKEHKAAGVFVMNCRLRRTSLCERRTAALEAIAGWDWGSTRQKRSSKTS